MIKPIENEVWVPIFRDYAISNMGRVISNKRKEPILMRQYKQNRDYSVVHFRIAGRRVAKTIHRLVAMIFLKNIDPLKDTVNHNFGKDDNRAESLCWMTYSENTMHGVKNGLLPKGSESYLAKLDELQVRVIKTINRELTEKQIAVYFKVSRATVSNIRRNKSWKHIC